MTDITALHVGGPTLLLRWAGRAVISDPTFDPPGEYAGGVTLRKLAGPAVGVAELGPLDLALVSHDQHADNLDGAGRALLTSVPTVLSTALAATRLAGVVGLDPWQTVPLGDDGATATAVPARHGPEGAEVLTGPVVGFLLRAPGRPTVYLSGDNASVDVARDIARRAPDVRLAVLHAGAADTGRFADEPLTLDAERAVAIAGLWPDAVVIPVHADGWAHFREPVDAVVHAFAGAGLTGRLCVLERGRETAIALPR
jgi:L-ascorbate metabolism protein UlaG (beta-lactamase superfamily)